MTEFPSPQDLQQILESVNVAEATSRAAIKEIWETRMRLKRAEASLALLLGALVEFEGESSDYVVHRLSQELRRLAEIPDAAAQLAGCADEDIDPELLQSIASHLSGLRAQDAWRATGADPVVMH
ncbi:MAG: hypothetical protein P4L73_10075 [Caulobacteraceae bacterium]|nr:hypothetical protein [Caulobacteraceae bacterium]